MTAETGDFEQAETLLRQAGTGCGAAECHGFLTGCLCASGPASCGGGLDHLLGKAPDCPEPRIRVVRGLLRRAFARGRAGLEREPPVFQPLLPDAHRAPGVRAAALRDWCAGFLGGLGHLSRASHAGLPENLQEFLRDLTQLTRLNPESADDDGSEADLATLTDYVRAGVIRLYAGLRRPARREPW